MSLSQYYHTLKHLRPVQIYGRVWHRIYRPSPNLSPAPALNQSLGLWRPCAGHAPSMVSANSFRFLNMVGSIGNVGGWDASETLRLWRYNLHYFDDLNADDASSRKAWHQSLLTRWIEENPPGHGTGWEPYPTSLRIVNWIKWALTGNELSVVQRESLAVQTRWLVKKLEIHLLGNHLWANAKALIFAGSFFEGPEATRWLEQGVKILQREMDEQILSDGGHFERSPMYHAIVLEDVLDLIQLERISRVKIPSVLSDRLQVDVLAMLHWLQVMSHPDGQIAFFNDAAFGIALTHAQLEAYAVQLGITALKRSFSEVEVLEESGYVRLQNESAVLICDVAPIGPDYLPGHAHADTLSFELSIHGYRVLVNGGTSTYESGAERRRQRGTAAHNTVFVDGLNSSEVWDSFRVARRARPSGVGHGRTDQYAWLEAQHDGYQSSAKDVVHHRRWKLYADHIDIEDRLDGSWTAAESRWHCHPDFQVKQFPDRIQLMKGVTTLTIVAGNGAVALEKDSWCPEFGVSIPSSCLRIPVTGPVSRTTLTWT